MESAIGTTHSRAIGSVGAELLNRMGSGDRVAFAELYDRLAPQVFAIGLARRLTEAAASDFVEMVLLDLWQRSPEFGLATMSPASWVVAAIDDSIALLGSRVSDPAHSAPRLSAPASDFDVAV